MESPQMYDSVQTLSQLDLKKAAAAAAAVAAVVGVGGGQSSLAMANNNSNNHSNSNSNNNGTKNININLNNHNNHNHNNNNNCGTVNNNNTNSSTAASLHHNASALVVKQQQAAHHMQQAAAANNNNNNNSTNNNNNTNTNNNNNNSILQKHMLQQYTQSDLDELTAQEITLDLQHLIDDQFREQEALGIFGDMVTNQANHTNGNLQANGVVSAAAKVLQLQQQHQHQQNLRSQQNQGYPRGALAYMPQAVHSGATYANNSSDENSSIGSEVSSNIKEEPMDPQEYRRQLQVNGATAPFLGAAAAAAAVNGNNGIYPSITSNTYGGTNGNPNSFTTLSPASVLHHQALPHLTNAHLASLKHHNKQMMPQRKQTSKAVDKGTDEYRRRRERNNIAVRKSREKAKVRSREVEEKVKTLLKEKEALLRRLEEMTNEIQLHKQVYMQLMNHSNPEITRIVRSFLNMTDHGI